MKKKHLIFAAGSDLALNLVENINIGSDTLVLSARNSKKIQHLKKICKKNIKSVEIIEIDFKKKYNLSPLKKHKFNSVIFFQGVSRLKPIRFITEDDLIDSFQINFFSIVNTLAFLLRNNCLKKNCCILFLSSLAADQPNPSQLLYSTSKICLQNLMKVLILEHSENLKLRVNLLVLGQFKTKMNSNLKKYVSQDAFRKIERKYPRGFGSKRDLAELITFLLSEKASYLNGCKIQFDGGASVKTAFSE